MVAKLNPAKKNNHKHCIPRRDTVIEFQCCRRDSKLRTMLSELFSDQMPFKIPLIFSQREDMSFCIYIACQNNMGTRDLGQFYCLNRTSWFVTLRVCSLSHSSLFSQSLRTSPTHTRMPHSTVVEVAVRVLSASAVYSAAQYLLFLGKATQRSIVLREWACLMNLSFCHIQVMFVCGQ